MGAREDAAPEGRADRNEADEAGEADVAEATRAADDDFADVMHSPGAAPGPEPESGPATGEASAAPMDRRASAGQRLKRVVPVASLVLGVVGAVIMDRGPERGVLVAWATLVAWLATLAVQYFGRSRAGDEESRPLWRRALHYSSVMATQSIVQLQLFFALPFFVRASALDPGHLLFMAGLVGLSSVSLWDPWFERALASRLTAPVLPAMGTFVVLVAVLPGTGLSTTASLWCAAFVAGTGAAVVTTATVAPGRRRSVGIATMLAGMLLPLSLLLGAARIVPAAPLRLVRADIGTQVHDKWVSDPASHFATAPPRLVCATAIASPLGVRDRLFHRWTHDGEVHARIELKIVGGRRGGYRTRSRIRGLGRPPAGRYTCTVETSVGQVLGSRSVTIGD